MLRWTLTHDVTVETLTRDPEGWEDIKLTHKRSPKYHGVFYEFSVPIKFTCEGGGKELIDAAYESEGIDAVITLLVEYKSKPAGAFQELFTGRLNMKDYVRVNPEGLKLTELMVELDDITQLVLNREKVEVDLEAATSISGTALPASFVFGNYDIVAHSQVIYLESLLEPNSYPHQETVDFNTGSNVTTVIQAAMGFKQQLNDLRSVRPFPLQYALPTMGTNFEPIFELELPVSQDITFDYELIGTFDDQLQWGAGRTGTRTLAGGMGVAFYRGFGDFSGSPSPTLIATSAVMVAAYAIDINVNLGAQAFNVSGTGNLLAMQPGERIWAIITYNYEVIFTSVGGYYYYDHIWDFSTATWHFESDSVYPTSTIKGWAIFETWARVCASIGDNADAFDSVLFGRRNSQPTSYGSNGCGSFTAVTSGLSIRGFNRSAYDKPVTCSLEDLFDACEALWDIGMGVENNKVKVETKSYFYDKNTVIFSATNIPHIKISVAEDLIYNLLEIGFKKWQSQEVNGLDAINTNYQYSLPNRFIKNETTKLSPYIGDGYAIELTRRRDKVYEPTTDYAYDNEVFVICLNRSEDAGGVPTDLDTPEVDENFSSVNGLLHEETRYNLRVANVRNLLRALESLSGELPKKPGTFYKIQYGEANLTWDSTMNADNCPGDFSAALLAAFANLQWDDGDIRNAAPLWVPELIEFEYPVCYDAYKAIKANPKGVVEYNDDNGDIQTGYIINLDYSLADQMGRFKLLRAFTGSVVEPPPVNPEQDDIAIWLESAEINVVKDGGNLVETWFDISGNNRDHSQNVGIDKPVWVDGVTPNGSPVVRFDDDFLDMLADYVRSGGAYTVYCYLKTTGLNGVGGQSLWGQDGGAPNLQHFGGALNNNVLATGQPFENERNTLNRARSDANFNGLWGVLTFQEDEILLDDTDGAYSIAQLIDDMRFRRLGNRTWNTSFYFVGDTPEFIVYSVKHNAAQKTAVENYLRAKHG